ncbi:hypothetical protein MTO96_012877 [Rhipicephalus appendiculatus]
MYIAGDVRAVREYIDDVTGHLRSEMCLQGVRTGEISTLDLYSGWQVRSCTIRRLNHVNNDGKALPFMPPQERKALDAFETPGPKHFDVAATLQANNIDFEATYELKGSPTAWAYFYGVVDVVRLEVVIRKSQGPDHLPQVDTFHVREIGPLDFGRPVSSVGDVAMLKDATAGLVRRCIVDTMRSRVAPVLADVLKTIPFPTCANEQE